MIKISSVKLAKKFSAHGRDFCNFCVAPDKAKFVRLVRNMILKCTKMILNIDFCSPEPKMPSNLKLGPNLWSLEQKL
jgi:hypothetical protein